MGKMQPDRMFPTGGRHTGLIQDRRSVGSPLEEAFCRWQDELLGTLYILLGSLREAEEAFQETFRHCWCRREQLSNLSDRKLWIFRTALEIARQRRATAWRRRWRLWNLETPEEARSEAAPNPTPEEHTNDPIALWRQRLMKLPPEEQEVFLLRQNAQLPYEQIADLLPAPLGVVKAQMRRALAKLVQADATGDTAGQAEQSACQAHADSALEQASVVVQILAEPPGSPAQTEQEPNSETIPIIQIG
mgnify:CR=1 FL=1